MLSGTLVISLILVGLLLTMVNSEAGSRFLVNQARSRLDGLVDWQQMEGSLLGPLQLRGVTVSQPGLDIKISTLTLNWQADMLSAGKVQVDSLIARDIELALTTTDSSPSEELFSPASLQLPLNISLKGVRLHNIQLVQDGQATVVIDQLSLDATLENNTLDLQQFSVEMPRGGITLTAQTTLLDNMALALEGSWNWNLPAQDPATSAADIPLSGDLALQGSINWSKAIDFDLQYSASASGVDALNPELPPTLSPSGLLQGQYLGDDLILEQLTVALAQTPVSLTMRGQLSQLSSSTPSISANAQWSGLQWPLYAQEPAVNSAQGQLQFDGTVESYKLALAAGLTGTDIPESHWQLNGTGDSSQLLLEQLEGQLLGGSLALQGPVVWDPMPRWDLQVQGHNLNPGQQFPNLTGTLDLALNTTGHLDPDTGLHAEAVLEQLTGVLLDYAIELNARAVIADEILQLESLRLESDGNHLSAQGSASEDTLALTWQLNAPAPGALLPGAAGTLTATGKVEGSPDAPRLQTTLAGSNLQWDTLTIPSLRAQLQAGLGPDDRLSLDLVTEAVQDGEQTLLESLLLQAHGSLSSHILTLAADTGTEQLKGRLEGGANPELTAWQGTLAALTAVSQGFGNWELANPSALSLAASDAALSQSCLQDKASAAQLCLQADWSALGDSEMKATLEAFPLEMLVPALSGEASGNIEAALATDGALKANGAIHMSPGRMILEADQNSQLLDHGGGDLSFTIDTSGLAAGFQFAAPEQGQIAANIQLPAFTTFPLTQDQPLAGEIQATLPDLSGFAAWVDEIHSSAGQLKMDMQLAGTLEQPQLLGTLALLGGAAEIPMAGLQLSGIEFQAVSNPSKLGQLDITGGMASGRGRADLLGQLNLMENSMALEITGDRLQVYNTQDARVLLTPDLNINWADNLLRLRGDLLIPRADITPKLGLSPATLTEDEAASEMPGQVIAPSRDVVIINGPLESENSLQPEVSFSIDSQVRLILGEEVSVNAMGFISRIKGSVTFTNTPEQTDLVPMANGKLSIEDGTFRSFGQDLEIETGQLIFADVPATEPELNVRAVRWIDNDPQVTAAGVLVTGPATTPTLELFSRPELDANEVQSYLLTGRSSRDKTNVLSVGTYLTPKIYVGYGYNMIEKTSQFNSLFSITPRYGVGAGVGEADNNIHVTITHER